MYQANHYQVTYDSKDHVHATNYQSESDQRQGLSSVNIELTSETGLTSRGTARQL